MGRIFGRLSMMRFASMPGAVLLIFFALFLIGCSDGLTEAQQRNNAGVEHQRKGRLREAIKDYNEAIGLDAQLAEPYYNRGNAYFSHGQYPRAIQDYNEAIRLDPGYAVAYANRAQAYTFLGQDKEAQQDVDRAAGLGIDRAILDRVIEKLRSQR
uniref:Putative TPR domain protein n=1 Tax=uncultured marine microorganism HF4000_010I05 TaxID=455517 RepID=B3T1L3_9ZZZZ|nr:putative TPR domain protein [uncultured marine microorganism HF4000_010I05]